MCLLNTEQTIGERICVALMPLIAVVEVLMFAVAKCFNFHPRSIIQNQKCGYASKDLLRLAEETRCNSIPFIFLPSNSFNFNSVLHFSFDDNLLASSPTTIFGQLSIFIYARSS